MELVKVLFDLFFPFIVLVVVWRFIAKVKKQIVPPNNESPAQHAGVEVNPFDVLKAMLSGDMEAVQTYDENAKPEPKPERQREFARQAPIVVPEQQAHRQAKVTAVETEDIDYYQETLSRKIDKTGGFKKNLRKAVIWAEIIAPPVGLREE